MAVPEALIRKRRATVVAPPPPGLKLVPPIVPRLDDAVAQPTLPPISVPVPPLALVPPPEAPAPIVTPPAEIAVPAVRARYAEGEPDRLTKLGETLTALRQPIRFDDRKDETGKHVDPDAYHTPSRGRAFLVGALSHLGTAMARAQERANAQGRRVEWGDVASGAVEALGSGVGSAINPKSIVYAERDRQAAELEGQYGQEFQRRGQEAQLREMEMKPVLAAAKVRQERSVAEAAATEKQIDNLRDTWKHLPEYKRGDPRFAALDAEAERLGVMLPDFAKDRPPRNPVVCEVDGRAFQYDDQTQSWVPAEGLPVAVSEVPVVEDGLTVKPGTALTARAQREQRQYQRGRDAKKDAEDEAERARGELKAQREQVKDRVQTYNALVEQGEEARRKLLALSQIPAPDAQTQASIREWTMLHDSISKQVAAAEAGIDTTHAERDAAGRFRLKPEPIIAPAPASQSRTTSRAITAATPEADVRAEARRLGKDEEAAVAKWRRLKR